MSQRMSYTLYIATMCIYIYLVFSANVCLLSIITCTSIASSLYYVIYICHVNLYSFLGSHYLDGNYFFRLSIDFMYSIFE